MGEGFSAIHKPTLTKNVRTILLIYHGDDFGRGNNSHAMSKTLYSYMA